MAKILLVYGTTHGHTALIAKRMAAAMRTAGHEIDVHDAEALEPATLDRGYDGVIVGGSVHAGEHQHSLRDVVRRERARLDRLPSAFFSVSLTAADSDEEARRDVQANVDRFLRDTGWRPDHVETIAGALVYSRYNIFVRHLMKLIMKRHGRTELDTSKDYDFTDWTAVESFARDFAASVAAQPRRRSTAGQ